MLPLGGFVVVAVAIPADQFRFDDVPVAPVSSTGQAVGPVGVDFHNHRLQLGVHRLPAVVHQELLGCSLGIPRLGEDLLHRLRVLFLVAR